MARGVNKVILIGTVAKDPEVRHIPPNDDPVCNVSLATNKEWKDKQTGNIEKRSEWHKVAFFKQQADFIGRYAQKGSVLFVEGELQTRKVTKDGKNEYKLEIRVNEVQILSGGKTSQINSTNGNTNGNSDPDWEHS